MQDEAIAHTGRAEISTSLWLVFPTILFTQPKRLTEVTTGTAVAVASLKVGTTA